MNTHQLSEILVHHEGLEVLKIEDSQDIQRIIDTTKRQQEEVLNLKKTDREQLKKVVQL